MIFELEISVIELVEFANKSAPINQQASLADFETQKKLLTLILTMCEKSASRGAQKTKCERR